MKYIVKFILFVLLSVILFVGFYPSSGCSYPPYPYRCKLYPRFPPFSLADFKSDWEVIETNKLTNSWRPDYKETQYYWTIDFIIVGNAIILVALLSTIIPTDKALPSLHIQDRSKMERVFFELLMFLFLLGSAFFIVSHGILYFKNNGSIYVDPSYIHYHDSDVFD